MARHFMAIYVIAITCIAGTCIAWLIARAVMHESEFFRDSLGTVMAPVGCYIGMLIGFVLARLVFDGKADSGH